VRWRLGEPKTAAAGERIPLTMGEGDEAETYWVSLHRDGIRIDAIENSPHRAEGWILKFPLAKGTSWSNSILGEPKIEFADEEVAVPAGRYACRKISFINEYPGYKSVTTWWLAADVGPVRVDTGGGKLELKELRKGKGKTLAPRAPISKEEGDRLKKRLAEHLKRLFKEKDAGEPSKELREAMEEAEVILKDLSHGDRERADAVIEEVVKAHAPELMPELEKAKRESNERNASASLKTITTAQADFRSNDRDGNGVNDFWVADVSGFQRIVTGGTAIFLVEKSVALADAKPCVPLDQEGESGGAKLASLGKPAPKNGYRFVALAGYDEGKGRAGRRFGFCAVPAEYGSAAKRTFIVNEDNTIWSKDTGGQVPNGFPADPAKEGWTKSLLTPLTAARFTLARCVHHGEARPSARR